MSLFFLGKTYEIPANTLLPGKIYAYLLDVQVPYGLNWVYTHEYAYQKVVTINEEPAILDIECIRNCYNRIFIAGKEIILRLSNEVDLIKYEVKWLLRKSRLDKPELYPDFHSHEFVISSNNKFLTYRFFNVLVQAFKRNSNSTEPVAVSILLLVRSKIDKGNCRVLPKSGYQVVTQFKIHCENFTSTRNPKWFHYYNKDHMLMGSIYTAGDSNVFQTFLGDSEVNIKVCNYDDVCVDEYLSVPLHGISNPKELWSSQFPLIMKNANLSQLYTLLIASNDMLSNDESYFDEIIHYLDKFNEFTSKTTVQLNAILETLTSIFPINHKTIEKFGKIMSKVIENVKTIIDDEQIKKMNEQYYINFSKNLMGTVGKIVYKTDEITSSDLLSQKPDEGSFQENYPDYGELDFSVLDKAEDWYQGYKIVQTYIKTHGFASWHILEPYDVNSLKSSSFYYSNPTGRYHLSFVFALKY